MASKDGKRKLSQAAAVAGLLESGDFDHALALLERMTEKQLSRLSLPNKCTPLHYACRHGRVDVAQRIINNPTFKASTRIWSRNEDGYTPLHMAAQYGQLEAVKYLVYLSLSEYDGDDKLHFKLLIHKKLADFLKSVVLNSVLFAMRTNVHENTALHVACINGHLSVARFLLKIGCDVNETNKDGLTCLHLAAEHGHLSLVKYFLKEAKSEVNKRDGKNATVADHAVSSCHLGILRYLARNDAKISPSAILVASSKGNLEVVKCLVEQYKCNPFYEDSNMQSALHYACAEGHMNVMLYLVNEKKGNLHSYDDTPLMVACQCGQLEIVAYLVSEEGINPNDCNVTGMNCLHHAAMSKDGLAVVKYLIEECKCALQRTSTGDSPQHCAAYNGNLATLQFLYERLHCDLNPTNHDKLTPLHYASSRGHLEVVKYIINVQGCSDLIHSANPLATRAPPILAFENKHFEVFKYYLVECHCYKAAELIMKHCNTPENQHFISLLHDILGGIPVRTFVLGNSGSGKSALAKSLISVDNKVLGRVVKVKSSSHATAGLVPAAIHNNKVFGSLYVYDSVGHEECYAKHETILTQTSHPLVLLTVSMLKPLAEIEVQLRYWLHILSTSFARSPVQVIVVGSHSDKATKNTKADVEAKTESLMSNLTGSITYCGFIGCDCRYPVSSDMKKLHESIRNATKTIRASVITTASKQSYKLCKFLSRFLSKHVFKHEVTITVGDLCKLIRDEESKNSTLYQLTDLDMLQKSCKMLSLIDGKVFLPHKQNPQESLLVLNENYILSKIHECLKAKTTLANMGILTEHELTSVFNLDRIQPKLAIQHLLFSQLCTEVHSNQLLTAKPLENYPNAHYFFPNFVKASKSEINETLLISYDGKYSPFHIWSLKCTNSSQFFTPRFLHTLFVQLVKCGFDTNAKHEIWRSGIFLAHSNGTRSIIELVHSTSQLFLVMQCVTGYELLLVEQRALLIALIKHVMSKVCSDVSYSEFLFQPQNYSCDLPQNGCEIPIREVARAVLNGSPFIYNHEHKNVHVQQLIFFDAFYSVDRKTIEDLYVRRNSAQSLPYEMIHKVRVAVGGLQQQLHQSALTYQNVYMFLQRYSIFHGGEIFVSHLHSNFYYDITCF